MGRLFKVNDNHCYIPDPHVEKNTFINAPVQTDELPVYSEIKEQLPHPFWE